MSKFADRAKHRGADSFDGQIGRLRAFRGARTTDDHLRVLRKSAHSIEHARAIMDRVMEQCSEFPPPLVIAKIAGETPIPPVHPPAHGLGSGHGCPSCRPTPGWKRVFLLVDCRGGVPVAGSSRRSITAAEARDLEPRLTISQAIYDGVVRCECGG